MLNRYLSDAPLELVDMALCQKSSKHSSHPVWGATSRRNLCTRSKTGNYQWALFQFHGDHIQDM
jgi:hypothetical protein